MTSPNDYAIEIRGLTKNYTSKAKVPQQKHSVFSRGKNQTIAAVNHLDLKIKKGELFGLLGPNGAGKTTLVKVLCTLLPPDEGTAIINGFDVVKQQMQVKASVGTLFSVGERGFFWRLSGYSNLEFFAAINNVPHERMHDRIMEVLRLVGLEDKADVFFQKYSGGMKRKLSLARAMLADPPILLLDEPTTGLDVVSSRSIREFILNDLVKKQGKTVLYTTHYIEEAAQMCNRVAIMSKGKIIALDTPDALKNVVKKGEFFDVTVQNITEAQENAIRTLQGVVSLAIEVQDAVLAQKRLRVRLESVDSLPLLIDFLFKQNIKLVNLKREEPTLEDAFIELSGAGITE